MWIHIEFLHGIFALGQAKFAYFLRLTLMVSLLAACNPLSAEETITIRVLSYNVHHCQGMDRKLDVNRISGVIKSAKPDLVALQEVDVKTKRSGGIDQASKLAKACSMNFRFGKNIEFQDGEYGNAILTKWKILNSQNRLLPNFEKGEQRGVLQTRIEIKKGVELAFMSTHFDHRRNEKERVDSAKKIIEWRKKIDCPIVLAGDLNATIDSQPLKIILRDFKTDQTDKLFTIPVTKPKRQIDFVLVDTESDWKLVETKVIDEKVASDHLPILSVWKLTHSKSEN